MGYHLRVKICGVTTEADARVAAHYGADAVGLNFAPQSPRCIDAETARAILRALPPFIEAVGVFDTPGQASSAYDRLNHPKRLECVGKTIHIFSTSEVKQHQARKIPSGDEANVVRFVAFEDDGRVKGYSDVVALRVGQCTVSLLIAVKDSETGTGLSGSVSTTAATHLSPACDAKQ